MLIAFEGLDQSGKETQATRLRGRLELDGRRVQYLSFPEYETPIGQELRKALAGERDFPPDVMQLLYVANRAEFRAQMERWIAGGDVIICDRYRASTVAYGEAQGLDAEWLAQIQRFLPDPALTILLDIAPETAAARKRANRDKYERDLLLLARVRESYLRQAKSGGWTVIDGTQGKDQVAAAVEAAARRLLARP